MAVAWLLLRAAASDLLDSFIAALCQPKPEAGGPAHMMRLLRALRERVRQLPAAARRTPRSTDVASPAALDAACAALAARLSQQLARLDPHNAVQRRVEQLRQQGWRP